jgi:hypothetical protein
VGAAHDQRPSQKKESKNQSSTFPPDLHLSFARACHNPFRNSYALKATNNSTLKLNCAVGDAVLLRSQEADKPSFLCSQDREH